MGSLVHNSSPHKQILMFGQMAQTLTYLSSELEMTRLNVVYTAVIERKFISLNHKRKSHVQIKTTTCWDPNQSHLCAENICI